MKIDGKVPLLSVVTAARNDNYMGDYLWRLSTCLNYLAWSLGNLGRLADVEVVLVDWDSEVPMHEALPLTEAAARIVRFVMVPPAVAKGFQFESTFPNPFVTNIGLRRARGEYILNMEADSCLAPSGVANCPRRGRHAERMRACWPCGRTCRERWSGGRCRLSICSGN